VAVAACPHKLGRVEFWGIPGKVLDLDAGTLPEKRRDFSTAMDRAPIREEQNGAAEVAE
jgi:hypothetical protein